MQIRVRKENKPETTHIIIYAFVAKDGDASTAKLEDEKGVGLLVLFVNDLDHGPAAETVYACL